MSIFDKILGKKEELEKPEEEKKPETIKVEKKPAAKSAKAEFTRKAKVNKEKKEAKQVSKRKVAKKDENTAHKILLENLISEKATMLAAQNKYVFKVHPCAGKFQIKEAVEGYYGVQVIGVNTVKISPKKRIQGRTIGWKQGFKKAIVTLRQGDAIGATGEV